MGLERVAFAAFLFSVIIHAWIAWTTGLSADEAHYLLYARNLDWSYFDHPPLVGWLQAPIVWLTDGFDLRNITGVLRLPAQLLWVACAVVLWRLSLLISNNRNVAAMSIILFSTAPVLQIHGIALLPDTLLCLWSLLSAYLCVQINRDPFLWSNWLALGLVLGLAGLSKYSAIFLALGLMVYVVFGFIRSQIRVWPWKQIAAATLIAVCCVVPVLVWNITNDWISFRYQGNHVSGSGWQVRHFVLFLFLQLLLFGPAATVGLFNFLRQASRGQSAFILKPEFTILGVFCVFILALGLLSGGGRSLPYWTSPGWVIALPFAAAGLLALDRAMRHLAAGLVVFSSVLISLLAGSLQSGSFFNARQFDGPQPFAMSEHQALRVLPNPFAEVHGWSLLGTAVINRRDMAEENSGAQFALAVGNWTLASRLAWYAWPIPVLVLDDRFDQFDLWWNAQHKHREISNNKQPIWFVEWSEMQSRKHQTDRLTCEGPIFEVRTPPLGWTSGGDISAFRVFSCYRR